MSIMRLLDEYTDAQVAAVLNERGLRTGAGEAFDAGRVQWVRCSARPTSLKERLLAAGMLTGAQIAAQLGVRRTTIGRWRRARRLEARICTEMDQRQYAPGQPRPSDHSAPRETARCALRGRIPWAAPSPGPLSRRGLVSVGSLTTRKKKMVWFVSPLVTDRGSTRAVAAIRPINPGPPPRGDEGEGRVRRGGGVRKGA